MIRSMRAAGRSCVAVLLFALLLAVAGPPSAAAQAQPSPPTAAQAQPSPPAAAQAQPVPPSAPGAKPAEPAPASVNLTDDELRSLLSTLEDDTARANFIAKLKSLLEARKAVSPVSEESAAATIMAFLSEQVEHASETIADTAALVAEVPVFFLGIGDVVADENLRDRWLEVILKVGGVLVAAFVVEWVARRVLARAKRSTQTRRSESLIMRFGLVVLLTLVDLVPILAFATAAYAALSLLEPKVVTRLVAIALINANVLARLIALALRAILAPRSPLLRLYPMANKTARSLYGWSLQLANLGVYGYFSLQAAMLLGLPREFYLLLLQLLGLAVAIMVIIVILKNRSGVATWIRGTKSTTPASFEVWALLRRRLADIWHVLAVVYVFSVYLVWTFGVSGRLAFMIQGTVLTIIILFVASFASVAADHLIRRWVAGETEPGTAKQLPAYLPLMHRVVDLLVFAVAGLAFLDVWGASVGEWLVSDAGRQLISKLTTVLLVIGGSFFIFEVLSRAIQRYLEAEDEAGHTVERSARARTLLPLARRALMIVLVIMATFIALSELGIDVAPRIACAGVGGIAVGFGAQSLVRDVITGFFILLENVFHVGDVVDLGNNNSGVVEAISIRTVRLRDLSGTVHTIPFGDVSRIQNLTRDFSYYLLNVGVAYREDMDEVMQVLRDLGAEMQADPLYRFSILEPIEILGVDAFADSAVIVKARIKTRPMRQWAVGREFNHRMKKRFDELGIEIPFPHQTVYFGVDKGGSAPPAIVRMESPATVPAADGAVPPAADPGAAPRPPARATATPSTSTDDDT